MAMKTVAVFNNKGGIGKTTISANLALFAAAHRIKTLAVGLDRQGDLCRWLAGGDCVLEDGLAFRHSEYLHVLYSPMELPERRWDVDLVIADCPPASSAQHTWRAPGCCAHSAATTFCAPARSLIGCTQPKSTKTTRPSGWKK